MESMSAAPNDPAHDHGPERPSLPQKPRTLQANFGSKRRLSLRLGIAAAVVGTALVGVSFLGWHRAQGAVAASSAARGSQSDDPNREQARITFEQIERATIDHTAVLSMPSTPQARPRNAKPPVAVWFNQTGKGIGIPGQDKDGDGLWDDVQADLASRARSEHWSRSYLAAVRSVAAGLQSAIVLTTQPGALNEYAKAPKHPAGAAGAPRFDSPPKVREAAAALGARLERDIRCGTRIVVSPQPMGPAGPGQVMVPKSSTHVPLEPALASLGSTPQRKWRLMQAKELVGFAPPSEVSNTMCTEDKAVKIVEQGQAGQAP